MYCICCDKEVKPFNDINGENEDEHLWDEINSNGTCKPAIENDMIDGGIIHIIDAPYGSDYDGDSFLLAICDDCIREKLNKASLLYYKCDYLHKDSPLELSKKKYRRRKRLDNLI